MFISVKLLLLLFLQHPHSPAHPPHLDKTQGSIPEHHLNLLIKETSYLNLTTLFFILLSFAFLYSRLMCCIFQWHWSQNQSSVLHYLLGSLFIDATVGGRIVKFLLETLVRPNRAVTSSLRDSIIRYHRW